jgi:ABC-2 type transport system permease protein
MFQRIAALVAKEFLALLKDKRSRTVIILPPILQLLVFGYAATFDLTDIPYAVFNEDRGFASRELLAHFEGSPHFRAVAYLTHDEEIAPLIDRRGALLVVHLGPDFTRQLLRGNPGPVQLIIDGRNSNTALVGLGYARSIAESFSQAWAQSRGLATTPARLETRSWFNPNLESRWYFVPGIVGLLTTVVTALVTALSVAREREHGTFDQLLVTPLRPFEILMGKAIPGFVIGMGEATIIIIMARLWFGVPLVGDLRGLYAGLSLFVLAVIGVGLMVSSFSVTLQQALMGAFLFLVPAIILSGFTTPIANMPPLVQKLTYLDPLRYFMVVVRGVFLEGAPMRVLARQYAPMAAIAVVNLTVAATLFRRRMH